MAGYAVSGTQQAAADAWHMNEMIAAVKPHVDFMQRPIHAQRP
jgi:hypothetical protein